MAISRINILVRHNTFLKRVLCIEERDNGDLLIPLLANQLFREPGKLIGEAGHTYEHGSRISDYRYSIHVSPESQKQINTIVLSMRTQNGTHRLHYFTEAIKQHKNFAPICARRCSNLSDPTYNLKPSTKGERIIIAKTTDLFSLCYMVLCGPPDLVFDVPKNSDFDYRQFFFDKFSVVIIWSFMTLPAHESGNFSHLTNSPEYPFSEGLSQREAVEYFQWLREQQKQEYVYTVSKEKDLEKIVHLFPWGIFLKHANTKSKAYRNWWIGLHQLGMIPQEWLKLNGFNS